MRDLRRAATERGVDTRFVTGDGIEIEVADETLNVVLDALEAREPLRRGVLEPARVSRQVDLPQDVVVDLEETIAFEVRWALELETEEGNVLRDYGTATPDEHGRFEIPCSWEPPVGYHKLLLVVETGNRRWHDEQRWIVTPDHCWPASEPLSGERGFGVMAQIHSLRSERDWGCGDLGDVLELCHRGAAIGADFVALSPVHALVVHGGEVSPYAPTSRIFRNPLLIDVEAVPELETCKKTREWLARDDVRQRIASLRDSDRVDYRGVHALKLQAFRRLHREFVRRHRGRDTPRDRAYVLFRREQGRLLEAWAVFQVLFDLFHNVDGLTDWRDWPAAYREPTSPKVRTFAAEHAELVDFQRFLQFEVDRQLAQTSRAARAAGMRIGLMHDLAFGSYAGGFDSWAFADLFVGGLELGCPPDALGPDGQQWGLPPLDPHRLANEGYRFWTRMIRASIAHGGALRIDHALGLVRQFWIPHGGQAGEGTYVASPRDALVGILALESQRHRAPIIAEDLGNVPEGMDDLLASWQLLSTRVLPFTRRPDGHFPPAGDHFARALLVATTHDLPTLAGWWLGDDLVLRHRLELLDDDALANAQAAREDERLALRRCLETEGLLDGDVIDPRRVADAIHAFIARTPSRLIGVWLEDLAGEREPTNIPGVEPARYPPWRRRLKIGLRDLFRDPDTLASLRAARRPSGADRGPRPAVD